MVEQVPDELRAEANREDWARRQVRRAGKSWSTHLAKFDGTVLPRESSGPEPADTALRQDPPGSWPSEEEFPFGTK